jgi:hypothetical protein
MCEHLSNFKYSIGMESPLNSSIIQARSESYPDHQHVLPGAVGATT